MIDVTRIKEGMTVYNINNDKIGTVDYVKFSDEDSNHPGAETASPSDEPYENNIGVIKAVATAGSVIDENDNIPQVLRARLNHSGYIRVNSSGFFESDYYVSLEKVTSIAGENVHVETTKEDLISV